jgi:hypothetical protein
MRQKGARRLWVLLRRVFLVGNRIDLGVISVLLPNIRRNRCDRRLAFDRSMCVAYMTIGVVLGDGRD